MEKQQARYEREEVARRGTEIYRKQIRPQLGPEYKGKIAAIDVHSGAFEVADNPVIACQRLRERCPDAQVWVVRVGYLAVHSFGGWPLPEEEP